MTTLWNTTGSAVVKALANERRTGGAVTSGNALTLVVGVDEQHIGAVEKAAAITASRNPCRLLIVVRREIDLPKPRLDAEILVGGRLGPGEAIVMRMYGRLALHAESVTLPLLAPDAPVVTWWHGPPPEKIATDPLGVYSDRRVTDCGWLGTGIDGLRQRAIDYAAGDTDLGWTRTTPWRSALASAFDTVSSDAVSASVLGDPMAPPALLAAGWIKSRLGLDVPLVETTRVTGSAGIAGIEVTFANDEQLNLLREGDSVIITRSGQQDQQVTVTERNLGELLTEELRRLDADETYAAALSAATGVAGLQHRSSSRQHEWSDPTVSAS